MPIGFKIGSHAIGPGNPVFIIAEAGVNHNGDLGLAKQLVDVAAKSGADAVKFQTFDADELASESAEKAEYQKKNDSRHKNQNEMLKSLQLSEQDFKVLKNYCSEKRIIFLSTPFDIKSANLLESLGVAAYKISSGEITNVPLLRHIAKFGKPIILSTGMADLAEVEKAVKLLKKEGNNDLVLLHCTTSYPAPSESLNLRAIQTLEKKFKTAVGFSDHSQGVIAPIVAIGLGACVIEKHFTLDKTLPGPDHVASLEPAELAAMVKSIREAEKMLGDGVKKPDKIELGIIAQIRKGIFAGRAIPKGQKISSLDLVSKRPVTGIPSEDFDKLIGMVAKKTIEAGKPIHWEDVQ